VQRQVQQQVRRQVQQQVRRQVQQQVQRQVQLLRPKSYMRYQRRLTRLLQYLVQLSYLTF
jgi:hypothetical protein